MFASTFLPFREFAYYWLHVEALMSRQRAAQRVSVSIGNVDLISKVYIGALVLLFLFLNSVYFPKLSLMTSYFT